MPPTALYWSGFPRYCLPRIRTASGSSITFAAQQLTAEAVLSRPLSTALLLAREQQAMKARSNRVAQARRTFPHVPTYRRSLMGSAGSASTRRQVLFVRRAKKRQPISESTDIINKDHRAPPEHRQPRENRVSRASHASSTRRPSPDQSSFYSTHRSSIRSQSLRSKSSSPRSIIILRPASRSMPTRQVSRPSAVRKTQSHKPKPSPPLTSLQPAPYWGVIPSPASQSVRRTALENQTFVSRRVGGQFVHEPLGPAKLPSPAADILQRGLSTSSRMGRIYDKRLPVRRPLNQLRGGKYTVLTNRNLEAQLSSSTLSFAKLDGSTGGSSPSDSSIIMYADEDSASIILPPPSRTASEAAALDSFTAGLQAHLTETQGQLIIRTRSPSLAQTIGSAYTLQDLLPFRAEFAAAGLAVTSKEQKGPNNGRVRTVVIPTRVPDQNQVSFTQGYKSTVTPDESTHTRRMSNTFPRSFYDLPNVANEAAKQAAAAPKPQTPVRVTTVPFPEPPSPVILKQESPPKPMPRQQPVSKKILPWLKKSDLKPGQALPASPFVHQSSPLSGRTTATTVIDFSPHPSEFWQTQGFDFDGFKGRHPNLEIESRSPGPQRQARTEAAEPVVQQRPHQLPKETPPIAMPIPEEENPDYGSERIYFHDKNLPPKSLRIQIGSSQEQKTDSDNRNHVLDEDDRPVLMRGDSVTRSRASSIQSQPDFSGFGTSDDGRPSPAQDEMMFKMDDELIPARQRTRQPFDNQRTERSRADAKRVTPWDFRSRCNSSEDYAVERITTDLRANETSASKLTEPVEPPPKLLGSETLSVIKTRMKRTFDSALRLSEDDALPPPIGPKQEVVTKEVLPECEVCRNLGANYAKRSSISGFSPWSEAKQGRSFLEWQAGVPFKHTIPKELAFEASLSSNALKLPCGHAAPGTVTASPMSSSAPTRGTTFKPPMGIEARTGEQKVSRRAVAARRKRTVSSISGGGTSSIFTIQEAAPKAAPTPRKPTLLSASNDGKVTDKELLKGLGIVLEAVNNEDVDAWINEVTGSGVRKFLADLSKMDKLGTGGLAQRPRRQATVRKQALEGTERLKEREGLERIQSMSEEGEM